MRNLIAGLALAAVAAPAWGAEEIPRYDVEAECETVASFGGSYSSTTYNGCMQMEQNAYNLLKEEWQSLSPSIRQECESVASFGGGSYSTLEGCVRMEQDAANNKQGFEY